MPEGFKKSLNISLIKNILSGISVLDNDMNFNNQPAPSKQCDFVNFIVGSQDDMEDKSVVTKVKVINENISSTNSLSNFSNLPDNNWSSSSSPESVYNDNYNDLYQTEEELEHFLDDKRERQHEMFMKNKSFVKNKIGENEIKVTSHPTENLVKNVSFITRCIQQRPMVCYDYSCKTRNPSFKHVELLTPVKEKKWSEDYKMELQFLQENFSEVLPEILYDVVRKTRHGSSTLYCLPPYKI
ncbi:uncharacterized protein LOC100571331 [Acyrthosiphon pisum]|uniref:Uncharacterized protein n=1 Tax=Acyrthosiphon pisum TaxID=7029 RepID=A0A8R2AAW0_ACYPI|nr:uncharacterized protein LOC100571331 [Acyrthosiphon pisum]|eukprot:XP_003247379.1 PREDICTED: uncharacterized protein LOC100571331 [Acyrthosiphon pisum]